VKLSKLDFQSQGGSVTLPPGGNADIPFRVFNPRTSVIVRGTVLDEEREVLGTTVFRGHFSESNRVLFWHITYFYPVRR
jgi:hypothetical protein